MPRPLSGLRALLCSCSRCPTSGCRSRAMNDLVMLIPELILTGMSLVLLLVARRIRRTPLAAAATVLAALAAALASIWILSQGRNIAFGGMLVLDGYSQFFKVLIAATLALAALLSIRSLQGIPEGEYHALLLLAATGMMFAVSANDLLPLYLSLELMTLCSYILVGIRVEQPTSNEAAIKYFLLGSFASALLIYGISLTYGVTGTTDFRAVASALAGHGPGTNVLLTGLAGLSIIVGSVIALSQTDMKRMLAYSSISHAGYALLGLIAGTSAGASATMTYAFFYVFMTLGAFGVVVALGERGEKLEGYRGLAAQRPGTAVLMLVFLMSLTGIPPTAGFAAKFYVILSVVRAGHIALAVLAVACSVVSAFFYMRVAVLMYMNEADEPAPSRFPAPVLAALAVAALVTVIGGIAPGTLAAWAVSP